MFFPFKDNAKLDAEDEMKKLDNRFFATRVYKSLMKNNADVLFAMGDKESQTGGNDCLAQKVETLMIVCKKFLMMMTKNCKSH